MKALKTIGFQYRSKLPEAVLHSVLDPLRPGVPPAAPPAALPTHATSSSCLPPYSSSPAAGSSVGIPLSHRLSLAQPAPVTPSASQPAQPPATALPQNEAPAEDDSRNLANLLNRGYRKLSHHAFGRAAIPSLSAGRIPRLAHGLEQTMGTPGVHPLKLDGDLYQFDPYLETVVQPEHINFDSIPSFVTSSEDKVLHRLAVDNACRFKGSTSSVTSLLAQLYFLFSNFKPIHTEVLSPSFIDMPCSFTRATVKPVCVFLRPRDGLYAIDSGPSAMPRRNRILLDLGKSMERMLTMSKEEFVHKLVLHDAPTQVSLNSLSSSSSASSSSPLALVSDVPRVSNTSNNIGNSMPEIEYYNYLKVGDIMLRSQIDCCDDLGRLFDLKTRAISAVRYDVENYIEHQQTRIKRISGKTHSFEREFYDMARSVFLKYTFQVRIGQMDGVFITYHNTKDVFGFEYVPLSDMDEVVFGSHHFGELSFDISSNLLLHLLDRIVADVVDLSKPLRLVLGIDRGRRELSVYVEEVEKDHGWVDEGTADVRNSDLLEITGRVRRYFMRVYLEVDGVPINRHAPMPILQPGDDLQVYYKVFCDENVNRSPEKLDRYADWLRRSIFFDDLDVIL